MQLLLKNNYKLSFTDNYSVLDGYYGVLNMYNHRGVITQDLPFEKTIDLIKNIINSQSWTALSQDERQVQYNIEYAASRNSIFYEITDLNNRRTVLVPDHWITLVNPDVIECFNMALVVDCGLQTHATSVAISNIKEDVADEIKHLVLTELVNDVPIAPKVDVTSYKTTWVTEDEFTALVRKRKEYMAANGFTGYYERYAAEQLAKNNALAEIAAYKTLLATIDANDIVSWMDNKAALEELIEQVHTRIVTHNADLTTLNADVANASDLVTAQSLVDAAIPALTIDPAPYILP
jgi:hypothetical protein